MRRKSIKSIVLAIAICGSAVCYVTPANSQIQSINCYRDPYLPGIDLDMVDTKALEEEKNAAIARREESRRVRLEEWRRSINRLKKDESNRAETLWETRSNGDVPAAYARVEIEPKLAIELWAEANRLNRSQEYKAVLETIAEIHKLCERSNRAKEVLRLKDVDRMKKHAEKMVSHKVYGEVLNEQGERSKAITGEFNKTAGIEK